MTSPSSPPTSPRPPTTTTWLPPSATGAKNFSDNELVNRYLNSVRNQDLFLKNLFDQYKKLGLYDDTVFIILGDHGEGFGEHGRFQHDNMIYEEGLRIPMIVHDPKQIPERRALEGPVTQLDILPTVTDLLGYEIEGGAYAEARSSDRSEDRPLMFSCWNENGCLASLEGTENTSTTSTTSLRRSSTSPGPRRTPGSRRNSPRRAGETAARAPRMAREGQLQVRRAGRPP